MLLQHHYITPYIGFVQFSIAQTRAIYALDLVGAHVFKSLGPEE